MKEEDTKEKLGYAFRQYVEGFTDGIQTARRMDEIVGGLNGVTYKAEKCFSIDNGRDKYPLPLNGLDKKDIKNLESDLIPSLEIVREQNGIGKAEVHIRKGCSTKHYKAGFNALVATVALKYGV